MFVYNVFRNDARVLKEARTLAAAGHEVTVIAVADSTSPLEEQCDGFRVVRIKRDPPHYKLRRAMRRLRRAVRRVRLAIGRLHRRPWRAHRRLGKPLRRLRRALRRLRLLRGVPDGRQRGVDAQPNGVDTVTAQRTGVVSDQRPPWTDAPRPPRRAYLFVNKPLMFCDYYVRAYCVARALRPDAVHAHDVNTLPVAAAVARAGRAFLVYDAHELYTEIGTLSPRERAVWHWTERNLIARAAHVITVCESIADELAKRYGIGRPEVLLNCPPRPSVPVTRDGGHLRRRVGLDDSTEPIVLYQGGFHPHRGLEELIDAVPHMERGVLVLMGWGVMEERLSQLVAARGLDSRVRLTGPVPQDELLQYTVDADVGVIPYQSVGLNNYYTTPNKLFEYIAAGVPVAGSRFPELIRFVEGLGVGRTFDPRDPHDIAAAINDVLGDEEAHAAMRERARAAATRLTWEEQVPPLLSIYDGDDADRRPT